MRKKSGYLNAIDFFRTSSAGTGWTDPSSRRGGSSGRLDLNEEMQKWRFNHRGVFLTKPVGASLAVDGESVGVTPFTGELRKGSHTLKMTLKTYYDKTRTIEVDRAGTFEYVMKAKPKPAPKYTGKWNPAIYRGKRSYRRNTSGTVRDNYTRLIWQKGRSEAHLAIDPNGRVGANPPPTQITPQNYTPGIVSPLF